MRRDPEAGEEHPGPARHVPVPGHGGGGAGEAPAPPCARPGRVRNGFRSEPHPSRSCAGGDGEPDRIQHPPVFELCREGQG